jgi:hypothetical protein
VIAVYVAGPFRGSSPGEVEQNIRRAERAAFEVAKAGAVPVCPHSMYRFFDRTLSDAFWLSATIELLDRCDALYLSTGWKKSKGSLGEVERAKLLKLPIFDPAVDTASLDDWLCGVVKRSKVQHGRE